MLGETVRILKLYKKPKKTSSVRVICLRCLRNPIHKLSKNYLTKVCRRCENSSFYLPRPPTGLAIQHSAEFATQGGAN